MLSQEEKIQHLNKMTQSNYANSVLFKLSGLEKIYHKEMNPKKRKIIDIGYQMIMNDIRFVGLGKPSVALASFAFREELNEKDYFIFVDESSRGDVDEIKELLTLTVDQPERRTVIDYLTFPLLAAMTRHLTSDEKTDIFLLKPSLMLDHMGRDMTFREYLSKDDYCNLIERVPSDVKNSIFRPYTTPEEGWKFFERNTQLIYDRRTYRSQIKWGQYHKMRQVAKPTQFVLKMFELIKQNEKS
jgi:hypothetical protein